MGNSATQTVQINTQHELECHPIPKALQGMCLFVAANSPKRTFKITNTYSANYVLAEEHDVEYTIETIQPNIELLQKYLNSYHKLYNMVQQNNCITSFNYYVYEATIFVVRPVGTLLSAYTQLNYTISDAIITQVAIQTCKALVSLHDEFMTLPIESNMIKIYDEDTNNFVVSLDLLHNNTKRIIQLTERRFRNNEQKSDIWKFGVLLLRLYKPVFERDYALKCLKWEQNLGRISAPMYRALFAALQDDMNLRPTAREMLRMITQTNSLYKTRPITLFDINIITK